MRRFDTPTAPPGWAGQGAELLRIVDPTGRAIAWLAPGLGASCVGYAVRQEAPTPGGWRQVLRVGSPRQMRDEPLAYGCAVLGPELADYGSAHRERWRFVERDPTAATCAVRCREVRLDLTARLEDAALHLDLRATNEGTEPTPAAIGLRLCFASGLRHAAPHADTAQAPTFIGDNLLLRLLDAPGAAGQRWEITEAATGEASAEAWSPGEQTPLLALGGHNLLSVVIAPG